MAATAAILSRMNARSASSTLDGRVMASAGSRPDFCGGVAGSRSPAESTTGGVPVTVFMP
ncbi:hypothetical protein GCM10022294_18800 [Dietzia aurantiaca]